MSRLHAMIAEQMAETADEDVEVVVGIETDRGPWVLALVAAGYTVPAVNPLQAARYRERLAVSGAKSDAADAHMLADMVRTDSQQMCPVAGARPHAEAIKVVTRTHKTLIWERTRQTQRLHHALRDYFPAALQVFEDLTAPDALALLAKTPDPRRAARLPLTQITAVLKHAGRHKLAEKAPVIQTALRTEHLGQPAAVTAAYAASIRALVAVLMTLTSRSQRCGRRLRPISGATRPLKSCFPSPGWARFSVPGCWLSGMSNERTATASRCATSGTKPSTQAGCRVSDADLRRLDRPWQPAWGRTPPVPGLVQRNC